MSGTRGAGQAAVRLAWAWGNRRGRRGGSCAQGRMCFEGDGGRRQACRYGDSFLAGKRTAKQQGVAKALVIASAAVQQMNAKLQTDDIGSDLQAAPTHKHCARRSRRQQPLGGAEQLAAAGQQLSNGRAAGSSTTKTATCHGY